MASLVSLGRALLAVSVVQPMMVRAFAATTIVAAGAMVVDVSTGSGVIAPVLLLQLFSSASGFAVPARRGHYDLVLTRGESRWRIGLMHWLLSASPGAGSWATLAVVEAGCGGTALRSSGTLIAMLLVSTLPWAANTRLPRLSAAIAWLVGAAVAAVVTPQRGPAVISLLRPWDLGGAEWTGMNAVATWAVAIVVVAGAMASALRWIVRMDVPLESAQ